MQEGLHKIVSDEETIVAIATPKGRSALGIVRISGPECVTVLSRYFKPRHGEIALRHREAVVGAWLDAAGAEIDEVVVTHFRSPHSYTGEDVAEISAHGNPLILERIVATIQSAGARLAAPGEFTLRAVAHGKLDLMQAEAVRDFVDAQTERQARVALRQIEGATSRRLRPMKSELIDIIARLEAGIDFAEDDVDLPVNSSVAGRISAVRVPLEALRDSFGYGKTLSNGLRIAILGKPNVGKSSLFNRLVSAERAIVTDIPGTTRDVITETVDLDGVPVSCADTAGIRETVDQVESIGVSRTFQTIAEADVALIVLDGSRGMDDDDTQAVEKGERIPHVLVINKSDLPQTLDVSRLNGARRVSVSAQTGEGFDDLLAAVRDLLWSGARGIDDNAILTNVRHFEAVSKSVDSLRTAESAIEDGIPHEMVLLDLYRGLEALDELTGEVLTDDILGRIFSTFCIGK